MILIRSHSKSSLAHMAQLSKNHSVTLGCHAVLPSSPFHTACCSCVPVSPSSLRICCPPALRSLVLNAPDMWGWGHLLISYFPYPRELLCTYGVILCRSCIYAQRFHTKSVEKQKQYLFIHSRGELQPLYPPTARCALSPVSGVWTQIFLPSLVGKRD